MLFICLQIFLARLIDVTLGTLRTILIVKGKKNSAAIIAFFEVLIWFLVAKEALDNVDSTLLIPICYAAGFAAGTYIGIRITNKYIEGYVTANITTTKDNYKLIANLREKGYGVSVVGLKNELNNEKKDMLFVSMNKKNIEEIKEIVKNNNKDTFLIFNEVKHIQNGIIK